MKRKLWPDWVNLVLGIWLFLSPWFGLGEAQGAAWNSWIFGALIAVFAIAALSLPQKWEEWVNAVFGLWLIVAPFALSFNTEVGAMWNHIVIGVLVGADALWAMQSLRHGTTAHA
jgi:hypothetical protein